MSLLLVGFYWVVFPILFFNTAIWLFRRAKNPMRKGLVVVTAAMLFSWFLWVAVGGNWWLDRQVKEMCAKDGGIRVYETVELPPEMFNEWGQINFYRATQHENGLRPEYLFKEDTQYFRRGNPQMSRYHFKVFRRSNGKLLGETVVYGRGGGGLYGPWHGSSFDCPDFNKAGRNALFSNIFISSKGVEK